MPFNHWVVEPKYLSRKELGKECNDELEAVTNNTLVAVIQQLACVAKYANWIFEAVAQDVKQIHQRSQKLQSRIEQLTEHASTLNAKSVQVPVGDLTSFSQLKDHYVAAQPSEKALFTSQHRPLCVQVLYSEALASPVHIMREIDQYREDGCRTSKYFVCTPVLCDKQAQVDLEIETRRPASFLTARDWQSDEELGIPDDCKDKERKPKNGILRLPSPQERAHALSLKYPYSDIPIDVTGFGFRRMASFRRSLVQQVEFFTRRKKKKKSKKDRRNTISGGADLEAALNELDQPKPNTAIISKKHKRFSMVESSVPFKAIEHTYSSLRLPAQNKGVQTGEDVPTKNGSTPSQERVYETLKQKKEGSSEQDGGNEHKTKKKSFIPISTLSQAMSVAVKLRETGNRSSGKNEDSGQSSSGNWSASSSTRASVESEHIPPRAASPELGRTSSQTSLSKDSALSETTTPIEDLRSDSNVGYQSDISAGTSVSQQRVPPKATSSSTTIDTAKWLRNLREEVQMAGDVTDGTSTTGTLTPLLGKRALSPFDLPLAFVDDEESSVYSVDTDGYYTSMHTDSGLRSMSGGSKPPEASKDGVSMETNDNCSTLSSVSSIEQTDSEGKSNPSSAPKKTPPLPPARNSSLSRKDHTSPQTENNVVVAEPQPQLNEKPPPPSSRSSSLSESDAEVKEHFKEKTVINASRIPSMCIVTPSGSDDEDQKSEREQESQNGPAETQKYEAQIVLDKLEDNSTGFHTVPRNFGKSWSFNTFSNYSTHSWPRSVPSPSNSQKKSANKKSLGRFNSYSLGHRTLTKTGSSSSSSSDVNEYKEDAEKEEPRIPLKYLQHITITPGGKAPTSHDNGLSVRVDQSSLPRVQSLPSPSAGTIGIVPRVESKHPVVIARQDQKPTSNVNISPEASGFIPVSSKVIHANNSMERKKNNLNAGRAGAHVTLDPSGHVIHTTNSLTRNGSELVEPKNTAIPTRSLVTESPIAASIAKGRNDGQSMRLGTIESSFCTSRAAGTPLHESSSIPRRVSFPDSRPAHPQVAAGPTRGNPCQPPNSRLPAPSGLTRSVSFRHPVVKYDHNTLPRTRISKSEPPSPLFPSAADPRNSNSYSATLPRHSPSPHYPSPSQPLNGSLSDSDSQPSPKSQMKDMPPPMTLISPSAQQAARRWSHTGPVTPPPSIQPLHPPVQTSTPRPSVSPVPTTQPVRPRPIYYASVPAGPHSIDYRSDPLHRPSQLPQPVSHRPPTLVYQKSSMIPQPQVPVPRQQYPPPYTPPPSTNYATPTLSPPVQHAQNTGQQSVRNGYQYGPSQSDNQQNPRHAQQYSYPPESPQIYSRPQPPQRRYVVTHSPGSVESSPNPYNYTIREASPTPSLVRMTPQHLDWSTSQPTTTTGGHNTARMGNGHVPHMVPQEARNGRIPNGTNRPDNSMNGQTHTANSGLSNSGGRCGTPQPRPMSTSLLEKTSKSKMSTDDLFAAIHQSKKRLNIKSDADRSLSPVSSRSASPALSVASYSSRGSAPETGVLSPRGMMPGDRRSWSGDMTVPQSPAGKGSDRRSWAVDRHGPSKPTTMHDFKMLLLQAGRTGPKEERQRLSASEMLKMSSPSKDVPVRMQSPSNNGYHQQPQPPVATKPYGNGSPVQIVYDFPSDHRNNNSNNNNNLRTPPRNNGHSPGLQFGRGRCRTPFHTRTDILSTPIWEDNMEDHESSGSDGESPHESRISSTTTLQPSRLHSTNTTNARFVA